MWDQMTKLNLWTGSRDPRRTETASCLYAWFRVVGVFVLLLGVAAARADRASDLVAIHVEAVGGADRIRALHAMRATGRVAAGGKQMHFTIIAARPDKVRVETDFGGRTLVQVSDGTNPPWEFDTGNWPPKYRDMPKAVAKTFALDAEFDDPLVAGAARGYAFEYGGEVGAGAKKLLRILVTRRLEETFELLLDPDTFLITRRVEQKNDPLGGKAEVVTVFEDQRPVEGVLIPHRVTLFVGGRMKQQTVIEAIQPNPELTAETFARPQKAGAATRH